MDWDICKQCRPRSYAAERGVRSGSTMFVCLLLLLLLMLLLLLLFLIQEVKDEMKQACPISGSFSQPPLRDNRSTSAVSALIILLIVIRTPLCLCCSTLVMRTCSFVSTVFFLICSSVSASRRLFFMLLFLSSHINFILLFSAVIFSLPLIQEVPL